MFHIRLKNKPTHKGPSDRAPITPQSAADPTGFFYCRLKISILVVFCALDKGDTVVPKILILLWIMLEMGLRKLLVKLIRDYWNLRILLLLFWRHCKVLGESIVILCAIVSSPIWAPFYYLYMFFVVVPFLKSHFPNLRLFLKFFRAEWETLEVIIERVSLEYGLSRGLRLRQACYLATLVLEREGFIEKHPSKGLYRRGAPVSTATKTNH